MLYFHFCAMPDKVSPIFFRDSNMQALVSLPRLTDHHHRPLPINHRSSSADTKLQKNCKPRSTITVIITATSYGHIIQAGRLLPVISCLCKMAKGLNCNHPSPSQFPAPSSRACSTGCYLHLHYCKQLHCIDHVCAVWQAACCHL